MSFKNQDNIQPKRHSQSVTLHRARQYDVAQINEQRRYAVDHPEEQAQEPRSFPRLLLRAVSFLISKG